MGRQLLRRMILALTVILLLEGIALAAVPFLVPDLMARVLRLLVLEPQPVPPTTDLATQITHPRPLMLRDSFDTPTALWDQSAVAVRDGHLAVQLLLPHSETYAIFLGVPATREDGSTTRTNSQPIDTTVSVHLTQLSGSDDAAYGVRVRQSAPDTYIAVSISPRGYWRAYRSVAGTISDLQPWTRTHTIETGTGYGNDLSVQAVGTAVTVRINGVVVGRMTDNAPSAGQVALAATTGAGGALRVDFDDVSGESDGLSYAEDFSDESSHFYSVGSSLARDGEYVISTGAGVSVWQNPLPRAQTTAARYTLSLDARLVSGNPETTAYGVVLGDTGDFAHTIVLFRPDGTLQVLQTNNNQPAQRIVDPIVVPFYDTTLGATNHIEITVDPAGVVLAVNGQLVGTLTNLKLPTGSVGMLLMGGDRPATAAFDNFVLVEHAP